MRFSPLLVTDLIVKPLRYFFTHYAKGANLVWDPDDKVRTIEVGTVNDYHGVKIQAMPRVLVGRSGYVVNKTGLTDNLAQSKSILELKGASDRTNMVTISGSIQIIIEAREEGTCELIADMVSHFLVWTRPLLCDTQGFNELGLPLQVSECTPDKEDTEKFKVMINIPFFMEEDWRVNQEALKLKEFILDMRED
jgi:hypothetical protein